VGGQEEADAPEQLEVVPGEVVAPEGEAAVEEGDGGVERGGREVELEGGLHHPVDQDGAHVRGHGLSLLLPPLVWLLLLLVVVVVVVWRRCVVVDETEGPLQLLVLLGEERPEGLQVGQSGHGVRGGVGVLFCKGVGG
jgi:hypothetical protein